MYVYIYLHMVYLDWLQAVLESYLRCTWWWWSSERTDTLGGHCQVILEMHLEVKFEWLWRCTWRTSGSKLRDHHRGSFEMHFEAMMIQTWRPYLSEFGDSLGALNRVNLEMHLEALIERDRRWIWMPWLIKIGGVLGGSRWEMGWVLRLNSSVS